MFFGARNNFIAISKHVVTSISMNKIFSGEVYQVTADDVSSYIQNAGRVARKKKVHQLFLLYTFLLYLVIIGIAVSVDDIEDIFNLVGAIAANAISFILPSLFYVSLIKKKGKKIKLQYYFAQACFIFFIPFGAFAVISKFII